MIGDELDEYLPRSGRLIGENNLYVNEADFIKSSLAGLTPFNETRVSERTVVFSLSSIYPLSIFRDYYEGTVNHIADQYEVTPGSFLESAERGVYVSGYSANAGLGVMFEQGAEGEFGYYDSQNGFFFRYTELNGLQIVLRRQGVETIVVDRVNWNVDKLDGEGPSGVNFDQTDGYIFEIDFTWYGYGAIVFRIVDKGQGFGSVPQSHLIHVLTVDGTTSTSNPNLPIRVSNTGSTGNFYVTGRQFSIIGKYVPESRVTGMSSNTTTVGSTEWVHIMSFRASSLTDLFYKIRTETLTVENVGNSFVDFQLIVGATLATESPVLPDNRSSGETAVEFQIAPTTFTGGELLFSGLLGPGKSNNTSSKDEQFDRTIPRNYWVSLIAKAKSGTVDITGHLKALELW